jgi:hypothetical protein
MTQTRFTCTLTRADQPACQSYAASDDRGLRRATVRGCPRHAAAALAASPRARVDWPDSKGLNQWEHTALELAEERSQLG